MGSTCRLSLLKAFGSTLERWRFIYCTHKMLAPSRSSPRAELYMYTYTRLYTACVVWGRSSIVGQIRQLFKDLLHLSLLSTADTAKTGKAWQVVEQAAANSVRNGSAHRREDRQATLIALAAIVTVDWNNFLQSREAAELLHVQGLPLDVAVRITSPPAVGVATYLQEHFLNFLASVTTGEYDGENPRDSSQVKRVVPATQSLGHKEAS